MTPPIAPLHLSAQALGTRRSLRRSSQLMPLEQRFMFDGAVVDAAHAAVPDSAPPPVPPAVTVRTVDPSKDGGRKEVVLVDTSLANYQSLEAGVREGVGIVEFDGSRDGLAQIALWAATQQGLDAIHILSHGSEGTVNLGRSLLTTTSLTSASTQAELAELGRALTAEGDLLLYGCDVAAGNDGAQLLAGLAQATGADVAASRDATGAAAKGGNWTLEAHDGKIEAQTLEISAYQDLLTQINFTSADADYSSTEIVKSVNGQNITFHGGVAASAGGLGMDFINGSEGLYAYEGTSGGNDIRLTVSVATGYTFDITSFDVGLASGSLKIDLTYADNATTTLTRNSPANAWQTLSDVPINDVKQVVFSSSDFGLFQNFTITDVKLQPPVAKVNSALLSADTGISASDFITSVAAQTISGTLSANLGTGEKVQVSYDNGSTWSDATSYAVGSSTWSTTTTLAGSGTFLARVSNVDASSTAYSHTYTLDTVAPTTTFSNIALSADSGASNTDLITNIASQTISATLSSPLAAGDMVSGSLDGGASWTDLTSKVSGTTLSWNGATLGAGSGTVSLKVSDAAGNGGPTTSRSYTLDTTAPTTTVTSAAFSSDSGTSSSDFITNVASQTVSGTLSANLASGETVYVSLNNGLTWSAASATVGSNTWSLAGVTLSASSALQVRVTDTAGNNGTALSQAYVYDATAPTTTFSALALSADTGASGDFITNTASQTISATLSSPLAVGDVLYGSLDGGVSWTNITSQVSGTTLSWSGATLGAGSGTVMLKVTDAAGNEGAPRSRGYTLDTTAPAAPALWLDTASDTGVSSTDGITRVNTPTLNGTAESGSTVHVYDGATLLGTTIATGGVWSFTTAPLIDGSHTLTAVATDAAGNASAASGARTLTIDTAAPTVSAVAVPANGTYYAGNALDFTVNFGEAVTVDTSGGTPRIAVTVGATTRYASYVSGSGTSALTFRYTVVNGDLDADGVALGALSLNGGSLQDPAGNNAVLTLNSVGSTAGVLVDASQPSITNVSASTADGAYRSGQTITITVNFSSAVTVDTSGGTPTLALGGGGIATYSSGSGSDTLTFHYTVGAGEDSADLDYSSNSAFALNGATITAASGGAQAASLTLATPGTAGSLGANKAIVIDTTAPTNTVASAVFSADTGFSATDFVTSIAAETVSGTLSANLASGERVYVSLDNGSTWTQATASVGSNNWSLTGQTLSGSGTLKVRVSDDAGNDGAAYSQAYVLDTTAPTISFSNLTLSADTGASANDFVTHTAAQTISATLSAALAAGDRVYGSLDNGATWRDIISKVSGTTLTWTGVTLASSNTLQLRVVDAAGNIGAVTSASYVLDTTAPTTSVTSVAFSADTGVSSTDFVTRTAAQTVSGTLSANLMAGDTVLVSLDNGATWTAAAASVGSSTWSLAGVTLASSDTLKVKVQDRAGNDGLVTSQAYVLDTTVATPSVDSVSTVSLTPVLSGQAALAAGETLTVTVGGATYALAPVGGVWHLDLATAVPSSGTLALALNNRYSVVATVTDPAGNTASGQGTLALSIAPIPMQPPVEVPQQAPQAQDSLPGPEVLAPIAPSPSFIAPHSLSGLQTLTGVLQERVSTLDSASLATTANFLAPHLSSPDSHDTLVAATPIADVTVRGGSRLSLQLPDDAFAHASGSGQITLSVAQADGRPLPNWLKFDSRTARFEGTPPPGFEGTLSFKVVARDAQGRIAVQVFKIVVTKEGQGLKGAHLDHGAAEPIGRASLAEQMRATRGGSVDRLAALSRHAPSVSSAA